jgi:hypothetical protein
VASFSCGGLNPQGGQVDIAGPGVAVRSSWPRPRLFRTIDGTSMATPHVAGVAALFAESDPEARGRALMSILVQSARRLELPGRDVARGSSRRLERMGRGASAAPLLSAAARAQIRMVAFAGGSSMTDVKVSVSVGDSHLERLDEVSQGAEAAGMKVQRREAGIGVLTGSIAAEKLDRLREVAGVENVETQREVRIPPPDSRVQ